jgi:PPK2 family polyphosphate:nucleotide phosphotransferase
VHAPEPEPMNESDLTNLIVTTGTDVDLNSRPTRETFDLEEKVARKQVRKNQKSISDYQYRLFAQSRQSLLVVFQAMHAAGKDSTIKGLTTEISAQGCSVARFGKPTREELSHDFLWRVHKSVPAAGELVLFNRSHYEDVLVVKVHRWVSDSVIEERYEHINNFEKLLAERGTRIIKFMMHISPEYQLLRFRSRLENAEKNWKFNPADLDERALWNDYMAAYEQMLGRCSTAAAPWYVIPSEIRWARDLAVSEIVLQTLKDMNPVFPEPDYDVESYDAGSIS